MLKDPGFMLVALGFLMAMVGYIYSDKSVSANTNQTTTTGYIVVRTNETETTTRTEVKDISNVDYITMDDAVLIAKLVLAEAEGEPEMGKRLVIDTVLNRLVTSLTQYMMLFINHITMTLHGMGALNYIQI